MKGHESPRGLKKEKQEAPASLRSSSILRKAGGQSRTSDDVLKVLISLGASCGWSYGAAAAQRLLSPQTLVLTWSGLFCKGCSLGRDQGKDELMLPDMLSLGDKMRRRGKLGKPPGRKAFPHRMRWEARDTQSPVSQARAVRNAESSGSQAPARKSWQCCGCFVILLLAWDI